MSSLDQILIQAIDAIEENCTVFYQQKNDVGYKLLDQVIGLLTLVIEALYQLKSQGTDIGIQENELMLKLSEAMNALQAKDSILLADIMKFEILDLLYKVRKSLRNN